MKKLRKINKRTIWFILYSITIIFLASALISFISSGARTIFGYTARIVVTGSMEPELKTNSIGIIKECNIESINVGDIICYNYGQDIVHRVIEKNTNENGKIILNTQGDANKLPDSVEINSEMIIGKVVKVLNWAAPFIDKYSISPGKIDGITLARNLIIYGILIGLAIIGLNWLISTIKIIFIASNKYRLREINKLLDRYSRDISDLEVYKRLIDDLNDTNSDHILNRVAQVRMESHIKELHNAIKEFENYVRNSLYIDKLGEYMEKDKNNKDLEKVIKYCKEFNEQQK